MTDTQPEAPQYADRAMREPLHTVTPDTAAWVAAATLAAHAMTEAIHKANQHTIASGAEESRSNKARRAEAEATAKNLKHCAIVVSDWLAGGCDVNDVPRPHIAALVTWTKESLPSVLLNAGGKPKSEAKSD